MSDIEKKTPAAESGSTNKKPGRRFFSRKPRQTQRPKAAKPAAKTEAKPEAGEKPARTPKPKQPRTARAVMYAGAAASLLLITENRVKSRQSRCETGLKE